MGKILLLILLSLVSIAGNAQYYPYDSNATYNLVHYFWQGEYKGRSGGTDLDIIIGNPYMKNGKQYYMASGFTNGIGANQLPPVSDEMFVDMLGIRIADGCMYVDREEYMYFLSEQSKWSYLGDKNYIPYKDTGDGELVLYDFNMQPGDIYPYRFGHSIVFVTNVRRVTTIDGVSRRLLTLSNGYELMEGLGCLNSPGMLFCYLNPNPEMKRWEGIQLTLSFTFKGDLQTVDYIFYSDEMGKTLNIKNKTATNSEERTGFYDLQGRRLAEQPRKGVYIRDGRKVVVK